MFLIIPWSLDFIEIIFKIKILASQKTHRSCYKARLVTATWEEETFLRYEKKFGTVCGQNAETLNVKSDGTFSYLCALKCLVQEGWLFVIATFIPCRILCLVGWFLCRTCLYRLVLPVNLCDSFEKFCRQSRLVCVMIQEVGEAIEGTYFELFESTARAFIFRYRGK
jgi:hypothetical protein